MLDIERADLFEIKLKGNDEEDVTIANLSDTLREVKKNFIVVNKLNDLAKNITDSEDKTNEFLSSVI